MFLTKGFLHSEFKFHYAERLCKLRIIASNRRSFDCYAKFTANSDECMLPLATRVSIRCNRIVLYVSNITPDLQNHMEHIEEMSASIITIGVIEHDLLANLNAVELNVVELAISCVKTNVSLPVGEMIPLLHAATLIMTLSCGAYYIDNKNAVSQFLSGIATNTHAHPTHAPRTHARTHTHTHTRIHIHTHTYTHYTRTRAQTRTDTHTSTRAHTHTHTHTYTRGHVCAHNPSRTLSIHPHAYLQLCMCVLIKSV